MTEHLTVHERPYKLRAHPAVHQNVAEILGGRPPTLRSVQPGKPDGLNYLGWRVVGPLDKMIAARPEVVSHAVRVLWEHRDADGFWAELDPALDALAPMERRHFEGVRSRTSVASYFLFAQDYARFPFFKPDYDRVFRHVYGDSLYSSSCNLLLEDYCGRGPRFERRGADFLRELERAGLPVHDALDLQGFLYLALEHYPPLLRGPKTK